MKNFNTILLYLSFCIIFFISGCSATKEVKKTKKETTTDQQNDIEKTGTIITEETQEGGSTSIPIIPLEDRERDEMGELKEMIQEIKDGGVTGRVTYYKDGTADCECDEKALQRKIIEMYEERDRTKIQTDTEESTKEKKESFELSDTIILSIMGGLVILGSIVIFLMFKKINAQSTAFQLVLEKIVK